MKWVALYAAVVAGSVLALAPATAAPLGAANRALEAQTGDQGLVEQVHKRRWHRHRHHHHRRYYYGYNRPYYYRPYYYRPYYYRPYRYYYPYYSYYGYPYYYRRPGISIYLRF